MNNYKSLGKKVTAQLVEMIEQGDTGQWVAPWQRRGVGFHFAPANATTNQRYGGANIVALALAGIEHGYPTARWATYKQWQQNGSQVRKGEHGTQIIKWVQTKPKTEIEERPKTPTGETMMSFADLETRLVPKIYTVFNAHQINTTPTEPTVEPSPHFAVCDLVQSNSVEIIYGCDRAYYNPGTDRIHIPDPERFTDRAAFESTLLHEMVHWTSHPDRLNRQTGRFGTDSYAVEELVAELGSAIAAAQLGVEPHPRRDHAQYLTGWLHTLKADPTVLFQSASAAQKAVDYLTKAGDRVSG